MKTASVLVANYQCGDTIKLTIESIRRYTAYPHRIIVCDDASDPTLYDDQAYLRECQDRGWLTFLANRQNIGHGRTLARLLDECNTDLAMVMDCDIQVLADGWLEAMVEAQAREGAAMVADQEGFPDGNVAISSWFFMLDMKQYPFVADEWDYTRRTDGWCYPGTDVPGYRPTGYLVWEKITGQGRHIEPLPAEAKAKYRHHLHISVLSGCNNDKDRAEWEVRQRRMAVIQHELNKLRAGRG